VKAAVISAIYGDYDSPSVPPEQTVEADWILVSDVPRDAPGWQVTVEPRPDLHPRTAAKYPKCLPQNYSDADVLIWLDGNVRITSPVFLAWCIASLGDAPLAQHQGIFCKDIWQAVGESEANPKYNGYPVRRQAEHYVASGFPADFGTWWTGLMIRRKDCLDFGTPWLQENLDWTYQDQISQPYVLWKMGMRPAPLDINWGMSDGPGNSIRGERFYLQEHTRGWGS